MIDNSRDHCQMGNILVEMYFGHHKLLWVEPYFPMLNLIEVVWIVFNDYVKRKLGVQEVVVE